MRFLFCSLESPGHLYPAIGIAERLRGRGHQVAFLTAVESAPLLSARGLQRLPPPRAPAGPAFRVGQWWQLEPIAAQVRHIESALRRFPADALVGQALTLGPLIVAEKRRLPVGVIGLGTYLFPSGQEPGPARERRGLGAFKAWRHREMIGFLNPARELFGLPAWEGDCAETPLLGDLFLVRSVPELEPEVDWLPARVHLVGSCLWEPEGTDPDLDRWLDEAAGCGVPLVYVQHGRFFYVPGFWPALVGALDGLGWRVAASMGRWEGHPGSPPEGFFVVRPHLPQGRVLRRAQAVVASGNSTAVLGALAAGVPSLLIPAGGEQPDLAALGKQAGVARTLSPEEATPGRIREELTILLEDPRYRQRAARYREAFARVDGSARAADLLEILARTGKPLLREEKPAHSHGARERGRWVRRVVRQRRARE